MNLTQIALTYAQATGCDAATAAQAAFVAATLLADMVGRRDIGDYFSQRASDMEPITTGEPMLPFSAPDLDLFDWECVPANEIELRRYRARWD